MQNFDFRFEDLGVLKNLPALPQVKLDLLTENFDYGFENLKAPRALENEDFLWTRWNSDLAWMICWCETILNPRPGVPR